jgi:hypothetical protein
VSPLSEFAQDQHAAIRAALDFASDVGEVARRFAPMSKELYWAKAALALKLSRPGVAEQKGSKTLRRSETAHTRPKALNSGKKLAANPLD